MKVMLIMEKKILVLFEKGELQNALKDVLQRKGFIVIEVFEITEAIEIIKREGIKVALLESMLEKTSILRFFELLAENNLKIYSILCFDKKPNVQEVRLLVNEYEAGKIFVLPIYIDKHLLPAVAEAFDTVYLEQLENDNHGKQYEKTELLKQEVKNVRSKLIKRKSSYKDLYNFVYTLLEKNIDIVLEEYSKEEKEKLLYFQKKLLDKFSILTGKNENIGKNIKKVIMDEFDDTGEGKNVKFIYNIKDDIKLQKSMYIMYAIWCILERYAMNFITYNINVEVMYDTINYVRIKIVIQTNEEIQNVLGDSKLSKDYTRIVNFIVEQISDEFNKGIKENRAEYNIYFSDVNE